MITITLKARESRRIKRGHPWIYSNEVEMDDTARASQSGELTTIVDERGNFVATATFNRNSLIAGRVMSRIAQEQIDHAFLQERLAAALDLRERFFGTPFYRLVHSEADGLPGLVIDRFEDAVVIQLNSAGMDLLRDDVIAALDAVISPATIILRNDSPVRELEGLERAVDLARGSADQLLHVVEDGITFEVNALAGQKTGWYFDQRTARDLLTPLCAGRRVLDLYCYAGGFALRAAGSGAESALGIDSSASAISQATQTAEINGLATTCAFTRGEVFAELEARAKARERYDIVICDPPAFVKSRKSLAQGLRGYRKLARLAARLVAPGGLLFTASCSHLADAASFAVEVRQGVSAAERTARILAAGSAGPDHPVHPQLPESAYLKWQLMMLD